MLSRGGCLATVQTSKGQASPHDELRVRCPRPERLKTWFEAADRMMATLSLEPAKDDDEDESAAPALPVAKLLTSSGKMLRVAKPADVEALAAEVRALSEELASAEQVAPGPASANGWQMLHVSGPAHVLLAGTPARGTFEARVSTNGQYLCEFSTTLGDGPIRATKSGWLAPATASHAIDEVLGPFNAVGPEEKARATYAAGTKNGAEQRSNAASTAEVFTRFSEMQDALGDACLPELDAPPASSIGL